VFSNSLRTPLLPAIISHFVTHGFEFGAVCVAHLKINKYGDMESICWWLYRHLVRILFLYVYVTNVLTEVLLLTVGKNSVVVSFACIRFSLNIISVLLCGLSMWA
jgi:hypothetical protein